MEENYKMKIKKIIDIFYIWKEHPLQKFLTHKLFRKILVKFKFISRKK